MAPRLGKSGGEGLVRSCGRGDWVWGRESTGGVELLRAWFGGRARSQLRSGRPLAELALTAGFVDQAHFTRVFGSAYGVTPGRYARLHAAGAG